MLNPHNSFCKNLLNFCTKRIYEYMPFEKRIYEYTPSVWQNSWVELGTSIEHFPDPLMPEWNSLTWNAMIIGCVVGIGLIRLILHLNIFSTLFVCFEFTEVWEFLIDTVHFQWFLNYVITLNYVVKFYLRNFMKHIF